MTTGIAIPAVGAPAFRPQLVVARESGPLVRTLWTQVQAMTARIAAPDAKLDRPPKTPGYSSVSRSQGQDLYRPDEANPPGPRQGSLDRADGRPQRSGCHPRGALPALSCGALRHPPTRRSTPATTRPAGRRCTRWCRGRQAGHSRCCGGPAVAVCRRGWSRARGPAASSWRWRRIYGPVARQSGPAPRSVPVSRAFGAVYVGRG